MLILVIESLNLGKLQKQLVNHLVNQQLAVAVVVSSCKQLVYHLVNCGK